MLFYDVDFAYLLAYVDTKHYVYVLLWFLLF